MNDRKHVVILVVATLGLYGLVTTCFILWLLNRSEIPTEVTGTILGTLAGGAVASISAMASMLTSTRASNPTDGTPGNPTSVTVENQPENPVPVTGDN